LPVAGFVVRTAAVEFAVAAAGGAIAASRVCAVLPAGGEGEQTASAPKVKPQARELRILVRLEVETAWAWKLGIPAKRVEGAQRAEKPIRELSAPAVCLLVHWKAPCPSARLPARLC